MSAIFLEEDIFNGCRIIFDKAEYTVSAEFYNKFEIFLSDNAKMIKSLNDKVENQRKELASLLAKNKKLEEENQKLRDINNKNFWPNGKAPVVDFPVLQYDSIPSWFDFTFTNFGYDSRRTLNLPGKIAIEGVSDDHKKIDAFVEHGDMFSGIFSICRMSDIKDLVDKYNALVVDNRHLELEKASTLDSLSGLKTNLECTRKKMEAARDEYEKMKEVLKRWHEATGCDNFEQARKKKDKNKELQNQLKKRDEEIEKLAKEIQKLKDDKEIQKLKDDKEIQEYKSERFDKLHNIIWGGPGFKPIVADGKISTTIGLYLGNRGFGCLVDAVNSLEADIALLKNREIQCAEGTYTIFIHPKHMDALLIDVNHDKYHAENRLIEECSELIQALAKRKRTYSLAVNYIGSHELTELAHVIISAIVYCKYWGISNELLQKAVQVKYPEPYIKDTVEN